MDFGGNGYNDRRLLSDIDKTYQTVVVVEIYIQGSVDGVADGRPRTRVAVLVFFDPWLKLCFQFFCDFHQENPEFTVSRFIKYRFFHFCASIYWTES